MSQSLFFDIDYWRSYKRYRLTSQSEWKQEYLHCITLASLIFYEIIFQLNSLQLQILAVILIIHMFVFINQTLVILLLKVPPWWFAVYKFFCSIQKELYIIHHVSVYKGHTSAASTEYNLKSAKSDAVLLLRCYCFLTTNLCEYWYHSTNPAFLERTTNNGKRQSLVSFWPHNHKPELDRLFIIIIAHTIYIIQPSDCMDLSIINLKKERLCFKNSAWSNMVQILQHHNFLSLHSLYWWCFPVLFQ